MHRKHMTSNELTIETGTVLEYPIKLYFSTTYLVLSTLSYMLFFGFACFCYVNVIIISNFSLTSKILFAGVVICCGIPLFFRMITILCDKPFITIHKFGVVFFDWSRIFRHNKIPWIRVADINVEPVFYTFDLHGHQNNSSTRPSHQGIYKLVYILSLREKQIKNKHGKERTKDFFKPTTIRKLRYNKVTINEREIFNILHQSLKKFHSHQQEIHHHHNNKPTTIKKKHEYRYQKNIAIADVRYRKITMKQSEQSGIHLLKNKNITAINLLLYFFLLFAVSVVLLLVISVITVVF